MKTSKKAILAAVAVTILAGGAGAAFADGGRWMGRMGHGGPMMGGHGGHAARLMERYDTNGDGKITQDEIDAAQAKRFAEANPSGSGDISLDDYKAFWLKDHDLQVVRAFQDLDRNGDGKITKDEFDYRTKDLVKRLDRNGDGALERVDGRQGDGRGPGKGWGHGDRDGHRMMRQGQGQGSGPDGQGPMMGDDDGDSDTAQ